MDNLQTVEVARIRLDRDGYAPDGRYFGRGAPVYCFTDPDGREHYRRCGDRAAARAYAAERWPGARVSR